MAREIRNLTDQDIEVICEIIDGWPSGEKLTWDALLVAIERRMDFVWSRQALDRHARIKQALELKKKALRNPAAAAKKAGPADLVKAMEYAERLKSENERLKKENNALLQQFIRWAKNADEKGITKDMLDKPLPETNRGGTRK